MPRLHVDSNPSAASGSEYPKDSRQYPVSQRRLQSDDLSVEGDLEVPAAAFRP